MSDAFWGSISPLLEDIETRKDRLRGWDREWQRALNNQIERLPIDPIVTKSYHRGWREVIKKLNQEWKHGI